MSKRFDSVIASPMGSFVRSPMGVLDVGDIRAVHIIALSAETVDPDSIVPFWDEKILRLSSDDLSNLVSEGRPPWWPAPHPSFGSAWRGDVISGDANTVWYSAYNLSDWAGADIRLIGQLDERWTIDIYRLDGSLAVVNSWRWHQPQIGGGRAWHISPFGNSTTLWGLARVHREDRPQPWHQTSGAPGREMYLVELDPETMQIRRTSPDLLEGLSDAERLRQTYIGSGGGDSSVIWVARYITDTDTSTNRRYEILEYRPDDFSLVRVTVAPRAGSEVLPFGRKRQIHGIGGDSESIWLASFWSDPERAYRVSELPRDFTDENRTILQDEILPPQLTTGTRSLQFEIG